MADEIIIKTKELKDSYLNMISEVISEIKLLDPIIKENQIRDFNEAIINDLFSDNPHVVKALENPRFEYLTNRMTAKNKIKERIEELVLNFHKDLIDLNNSK